MTEAIAIDRKLLLRWSDDLLERLEQRRLRGDAETRVFAYGRIYDGMRQLWAATGFWRPPPVQLASCYAWVYEVQAECLLLVADDEAA